jgi:hypothetical protein
MVTNVSIWDLTCAKGKDQSFGTGRLVISPSQAEPGGSSRHRERQVSKKLSHYVIGTIVVEILSNARSASLGKGVAA